MQIDAGYQHTCAITDVGGIKCWGSNDHGQLGNGTTTDSRVPVDVAGLSSGVSSIAAGGWHTCAVTNSGAVKCWGSNDTGKLGNATVTDSSVPVDVSGVNGVQAVVAGAGHTCALRTGGGVSCWGSNEYKQLGTGLTTDSSVPLSVSGLGSGVIALAAGVIHSCAVMSAGGVKCWGYAGSGGMGTATPSDVPGLESGVVAVAAGYEQTCALTTGGEVKCWGSASGVPIVEPGLGSEVTAISADLGHACAVTTGGGVKCWGSSNTFGQLGDGTRSSSNVPVDVADLTSGVTAVSVGGEHACALMSGGSIACWGDNIAGQVGEGTPCDSSDVPVDVNFDSGSTGIGPTGAPIGELSHATAPTDVILRLGDQPVVGIGELDGERFEPVPAFTLYGDGTVIFWWDGAPPLPAEDSPILRGAPFAITHLDEDEIQALLQFALGEGGLGEACELYETRDTDVAEYFVFTVRAGDVDKRVEGPGANRFPELVTHLLNIDRVARQPAQVFVPDDYWGNLLTAGPWIELGVLPDPRDADVVAWPWPNLKPEDFAGLTDTSLGSSGRRVMSKSEAAVLGLSDNGGVVARIYVLGPDGTTVYSFSLWPMLPDQTG